MGEPKRVGRIMLGLDYDDPELQRERERLLALNEADAQERNRKRRERALEECRATIPPLYRQPFNPSYCTLPASVIRGALAWRPDRETGLGFGICGESGGGKTRLLCAVLMSLEAPFLFVGAAQLAKLARERFDEDKKLRATAAKFLEDALAVHVLALDDLGDEAPSETTIELVKLLVEHRTAHLLPLLWTSNATSARLAHRYGYRGPSIIRRLQEFAPVIVQ